MNELKQTASEILDSIAIADTTWKSKAEYRQKNKEWLRRSAKIAIQVLLKLEENHVFNKTPDTQKELAELLGISPQQVNKIVKGKENLTLETISRLERALNVQLIEICQTSIVENTSSHEQKAILVEVSKHIYEVMDDQTAFFNEELQKSVSNTSYAMAA